MGEQHDKPKPCLVPASFTDMLVAVQMTARHLVGTHRHEDRWSVVFLILAKRLRSDDRWSIIFQLNCPSIENARAFRDSRSPLKNRFSVNFSVICSLSTRDIEVSRNWTEGAEGIWFSTVAPSPQTPRKFSRTFARLCFPVYFIFLCKTYNFAEQKKKKKRRERGGKQKANGKAYF